MLGLLEEDWEDDKITPEIIERWLLAVNNRKLGGDCCADTKNLISECRSLTSHYTDGMIKVHSYYSLKLLKLTCLT